MSHLLSKIYDNSIAEQIYPYRGRGEDRYIFSKTKLTKKEELRLILSIGGTYSKIEDHNNLISYHNADGGVEVFIRNISDNRVVTFNITDNDSGPQISDNFIIGKTKEIPVRNLDVVFFNARDSIILPTDMVLDNSEIPDDIKDMIIFNLNRIKGKV